MSQHPPNSLLCPVPRPDSPLIASFLPITPFLPPSLSLVAPQPHLNRHPSSPHPFKPTDGLTPTNRINSPVLPRSFSGNQPKTIRLYPLSNYNFGTKENQPEEDPSVLARLKRLEEHYEQHGMRRTCEGILVCHEHNHPHILMLQIANAFFKLSVITPRETACHG